MREKNRRKRKGEFSTVWKTPPVHGGKAETWGRSGQGVSEIKNGAEAQGNLMLSFRAFYIEFTLERKTNISISFLLSQCCKRSNFLL